MKYVLSLIMVLSLGFSVIPTDHHGRCHGVVRPAILVYGNFYCTRDGWRWSPISPR